MSSMAALSLAAVAELETDFDEIEQELRTAVGDHREHREVVTTTALAGGRRTGL
jgi:hypothetical protein